MDKEIKWAVGVIVAVEVVFWALLLFFVYGVDADLTTMSFTHLPMHALFEIIIIGGFLPAYVIVLAFVSASLSGGFYKLLKGILGTRGTYVHAKVRTQRRVSFRHYYSKAFFPALMSMSVALLLMDFNRMFSFIFTDLLTGPTPQSGGSFLIFMSFIALPFCAFVFLIFTALNASGIFITTKTNEKGTELIMKKFGGHFLQYIKGFTGFAAVMSYILLFGKYFVQEILSFSNLPILAFSFGMPFVLAMFVLPATIICERRMFGGHHSLKPTLSKLADITDDLDYLEQKYRARLGDLEQRILEEEP